MHISKPKTSVAIAALATSMLAFGAAPASANLITISGDLGTVECTPSCEAFTGAGTPGEPTGLGTLSSSDADPYEGQPADEASEATRLNTLAGTSFDAADATTTTGSGSSDTFSTLAEYVTLKIGNQAIYLYNSSGGMLDVVYTSFAGAGSGLSNYTEFGEIPIPGAIWLMGAGLAGMGFASRRKKVTA